MSSDPENRESYPKSAVVKMGIGNNVRRIYVDRLVDEKGNLSYNMLARWAIRYSPAFKDKEEDFASDWETQCLSWMHEFDVEITYVDEDGDQVCFSSDEEFADAVLQTTKLNLQSQSSVILRCKADVKERKPKKKKSKSNAGEAGSDTEPPRLKWGKKKSSRQIQEIVDFCASHLSDVVVSVVTNSQKTDERSKNEDDDGAANNSDKVEREANEINDVDAASCKDAASQTSHPAAEEVKLQVKEEVASNDNLPISDCDAAAGKGAVRDGPVVFDHEFVHARHTCDGCRKTPIIGIRYHAQNTLDYDLCSDCMADFKGTEIVFKPEQLACDMRFQSRAFRQAKREQRFLHRAERRKNRGVPPPARRHIPPRLWQLMTEDLALKEAIRVSLLEETAKKNAENYAPEKSAQGASDNSPNPPKDSEVASNFAPEDDNLAKVVNAIGMTVGQCALIVGAVVDDLVESNRNAKKAAEAASNRAPDAGEPTENSLREVLAVRETDLDLTVSSVCSAVPSVHASPEPVLQEVNKVEDKIPQVTEATERNQEGFVDDEWDVVDIGRDALAAIGSSMYLDDLSRSAEELASVARDVEKSGEEAKFDSDISCVSSVASVESADSRNSESFSGSPAPLSAVLLARWDEELKQLRQLGFTDDRKSLEALELLEAADLGVDSDIAVSLNEVANWLLNHAD